MFAGKRWCFTACVLLMTTWEYVHNEIQTMPLIIHNGSQFPKIKKSSLLRLHDNNILPKWSDDIFRNMDVSNRLMKVEPGFDLSEKEIKKFKAWPGGAIPYYIDEFSYDKVFRDRIRSVLDMTNSATGLNFLELHRPPDDAESRWVFFVNRQGLLSCIDHPYKNFTSEGVQKVVLGYDCLSSGEEFVAILLALVGIPPQHNAPDRDKYINIVKHNIMPGKKHLFKKLRNKEWLFHDFEYDFESATHYNTHKYTANGRATIKVIAPENAVIKNKGLSYMDIWKVRTLYNFISNKQRKSMSKLDCKKLFIRGPNFSNFVPESDDEDQPRKKPNQYLGMSENSKNLTGPVSNESDNQNQSEEIDESNEKSTQNNSVTEKFDNNEGDEEIELSEEPSHESNNEAIGDSANNAQNVTNDTAGTTPKSRGLKFKIPGKRPKDLYDSHVHIN